MGQCPAHSPLVSSGDGRQLHRGLQDPLRLRLLAAGDRHPGSGDDGNDATAADPNWNSQQNTPAVSDYPSTQSIFSGAAAVVLASFLGTDQVAFTMTSGPPFANIKRSFTSLSQAARESADSRVYAGIHFRSACEDGLVLGRKIGQRVAISNLQPLRN